jgi:hypothetical protein
MMQRAATTHSLADSKDYLQKVSEKDTRQELFERISQPGRKRNNSKKNVDVEPESSTSDGPI